MGDHAVGLRGQVGQQLVFDGRQVQRLAGALDHAAHEVDAHVAERDHRLAGRRLLLVAAQLRAHARHQFAGAEGLDQVVVGAGIERRDLVGFAAARRQHDDRHRPTRRAGRGSGPRRRRRAGPGRAPPGRGGACRPRSGRAAAARPRAPRSPRPPASARTKRRISASSSTIRMRVDFAHCSACMWAARLRRWWCARSGGGVPRGRVMMKRAPPPRRVAVLAADGAAMRLHDGAADRQAQADARAWRSPRWPRSNFSNMRFLAPLGQAGAVVVDGRITLHRSLGARADLDGAAGGRVLGGVLQQVDQHALDQHGIEVQQRQVVGQVARRAVAPGQRGAAGRQRAADHFLERLPLRG